MSPKKFKVRTKDYYQTNRFQDGSFSYKEFPTDIPPVYADMGVTSFNLKCPVARDWDTANQRLLFIVQHVDSEDLKSKKLMSSQGGIVLTNLVRHTHQQYHRLTGKKKDFALAVANFNFAKTYHLDAKHSDAIDELAAKRIYKIVEDLQPTHIFILGDSATSKLLNKDINPVMWHRGWVFDFPNSKSKVVSTIDFTDCYRIGKNEMDEADDEETGSDSGFSDNSDRSIVAKANLLGFVSRQLLSLYFNKLPFSIADVQVKPKVVKNIKQFDILMSKLYATKVIGFDVETDSLAVLNNRILIAQFAVTEDTGYILPIDHPEAGWSEEERAYIQVELRKFFGQQIKYNPKDPQCLVGHNLKFEMRILRKNLGLPVIHWPLFDTMAGLFCLDENSTALKNMGVPYGNLAQICCHYGNDFYNTKEGFGKKDRDNIAQQSLDDTTFLEYCAFDVQGPLALWRVMNQEAETQTMGTEESYGSYYRHFVLTQMSNIQQTFSVMEEQGVYMDLPFMLSLLDPDSPINDIINSVRKEFLSLDSVKKANKILSQRQKKQNNGLFGKVQPWVFDLSTKQHLMTLFFDVLQLEPVEYGKPNKDYPKGQPSLGKAFQTEYKADYPEVALLERYAKLLKLRNSYVNAFYRKISESADGAIDSRLRPGFGFFDVVTGRSNSFNPSLQQLPTRTAEAKYIKRMFISEQGRVQIKLDFSAHEVRCWGLVGQDTKLCGLFAKGRQMREEYMLTNDPDLPKKIKIYGDLHRINVARFFNIDLSTASSELIEEKRDQVKAIVFGSIYGRSVKSIAKQIGISKEECQKVYDTFFAEYNVAGSWLQWAKDTAITFLHTHSLIGRKRNLYAFLTGNDAMMAAAGRQAMNSPIQGLASDIALTASRVFSLEWEKVCRKFNWITDESTELPFNIQVMVHDSSRGTIEYAKVFAVMQVLNWSYTKGTQNYYEETFNIKFLCDLEIDFEIGVADSLTRKWDWSFPNLLTQFKAALKDAKDEGIDPNLADVDTDAYVDELWEEWQDSKHKRYLDKHYPWW